jgi:hypothetical protein
VRIPDTALNADGLMPPLEDVVVGDRWEAFFESPIGGPRCYGRAERDGWRQLFTMGPEYARSEVADVGRLQIAIRERDLLRVRFDRVCGAFHSA